MPNSPKTESSASSEQSWGSFNAKKRGGEISSSGSPLEEWLGKENFQIFIKALCSTIINEIKQEQDRMKKASQKIREAIRDNQ